MFRTPWGFASGGFSMRSIRTIIMIDGGHLRVIAGRHFQYSPDLIEDIAHHCVGDDERLIRILYYDCAPYQGTVKLPVSGNDWEFKGSDVWLKFLAQKDLFAVRLGILKFRGWKPKSQPVASTNLSDADFTPNFEQKGVDMRIGMDVASYSVGRLVDRIILITADTDCVPAMKLARKNAVQVVLVNLPSVKLASELRSNADYTRQVTWPAKLTSTP
jgi:uncharacterized LabA/DUF88 family protein